MYKRYKNTRNKLEPSESVIQRHIMEMLPYYNVFPIRINSGHVMTKKNYLFRGAPAGTPDILGVRHPDGRFIAIEVKRPSNKPTEAQERMMEDLRGFGAIVFVATCIEDLKKYLGKA